VALAGKKRVLADVAFLVLYRHDVISLLLTVAVVWMLVVLLSVLIVVVVAALLRCRVHAKRCTSHQNTIPDNERLQHWRRL